MTLNATQKHYKPYYFKTYQLEKLHKIILLITSYIGVKKGEIE